MTLPVHRPWAIDFGRVAFVSLAFLSLALLPLLVGNYGLDFVTKIMVYAILALSLELLVGTTGLVCQVMLMGRLLRVDRNGARRYSNAALSP